ncbi:hypothetical protein Q5424_20020 [Conexibacter sp. JD483]|uniref:hypothetical protein n=1 Tax=unclassified Conexibacter TaxID=2627773 RepID=UPI0027288F8B|nr:MULTISPECIES: hypothetical protein [unclassified Conexibacter]MDO8187386.1 hypothetical protein [Conexibacter sp. CPCC 205706]MDO8200981.1 hypothetical protein [Conexibacter sp. CPCC 205762]MDR9371397.1 hypothetical protein [Conexibacter sp. JD483]
MPANAERQRIGRAAALAAAVVAAALLSACGGSALQVRSTPEPKSPADSTVVLDCGGYSQVAPVQLVLGCRRRGFTLERLKWRDWGHERAIAVGRLVPGGESRGERVRVEASGRILRHDATLAYRRVTVTLERGRGELRYEMYDGYLQEAGDS